eukprot:7105062-Prymnesium_polylepis.1
MRTRRDLSVGYDARAVAAVAPPQRNAPSTLAPGRPSELCTCAPARERRAVTSHLPRVRLPQSHSRKLSGHCAVHRVTAGARRGEASKRLTRNEKVPFSTWSRPTWLRSENLSLFFSDHQSVGAAAVGRA